MSRKENMELTYKQQLSRILGVTGWSRDHLSDLLGISNFALSRYLKNRRIPASELAERIVWLYKSIVVPVDCEITKLKNTAETTILTRHIETLKTGGVCKK
jgi:predicted transcriptional regulator